jgi:hypothetical protein
MRAWYLRRALSGWRTRSCCILAGIAAGSVLAACGGQARQDAGEPSGVFPVEVTTASVPAAQKLSQHTNLVIQIRNAGHKTIPDIAVTITDPKYGTSLKPFAQWMNMPGLASHSRQVWVVDRPPGPCTGSRAYSCQAGGTGGAVTAYANTWALGRLAPGQTTTFKWAVTAVAPGTHQIRYRVAAGLNGKAKAQLAGGGVPQGIFTVKISAKPAQSYVNNSNKIVTTSQ